MSDYSQKSSWRRAAVRISGSALILALLFAVLPLGELWATLRRLPLALWLAVLAGYLGTHLVGVLKWRLMVNLAGAGLSYAQAVRCYFGGLFGTLFLPSIVGGDVVRAGLALRLGRSKAGVLLGSLLDRLLDVAALTGLAAIGALLLPRALDAQSRAVFRGVAAFFVVAVASVLAVIALVPLRRFSYRMRRRLVRLRQAAQSMSGRPQRVLLALGLGGAVQTSFVLLTATIAAASGLHLLLRVWLFAWPLAKLSALLPVTQGGIGVREAALAALLAPFGARPVVAVAVGLVWEAIVISGGLLAGLVSFLLGRASAGMAARPAAVSSTPEKQPQIPRS